MKTFFAIAIYIIAIVCIVVFAGVIVTTLMFWPPCTQLGHACVVDGWSIAGLAATVLAVAATVLAVLGAVAVAAWWTSLNDRVNDQITKLYEAQKAEVNAQVDRLLQDQQRKVIDQLAALHDRFVEAHTGVDRALALAEQAYRKAEVESTLLEDLSANTSRISAELEPLKESAQKLSALMDGMKKLASLPVPEGPMRITVATPTQDDRETPGAPSNGVSS